MEESRGFGFSFTHLVNSHKFLVTDFHFQVHVRRDRSTKIMRTKWWKLKGDASQVFKNRVIAEGL
jgi:hypothetical protein